MFMDQIFLQKRRFGQSFNQDCYLYGGRQFGCGYGNDKLLGAVR
jgi:hypothetical protein